MPAKVPLTEKYPERRSDIDKYVSRTEETLKFFLEVSGLDPSDKNGILERMRKDIGRAHALANDIMHELDEATESLHGRVDGLREALRKILGLYKEICGLSVPPDILWQFKGDTAHEISEIAGVDWAYDMIFRGEEPKGSFPIFKDLGVDFQPWLSGLMDLPGEMGRLINDLVAMREVPQEDEFKFRFRLMKFEKMLSRVCRPYRLVYEQVIRHNRRPGWPNTFKALLDRMQGAVIRHQERLLEALGSVTFSGDTAA